MTDFFQTKIQIKNMYKIKSFALSCRGGRSLHLMHPETSDKKKKYCCTQNSKLQIFKIKSILLEKRWILFLFLAEFKQRATLCVLNFTLWGLWGKRSSRILKLSCTLALIPSVRPSSARCFNNWIQCFCSLAVSRAGGSELITPSCFSLLTSFNFLNIPPADQFKLLLPLSRL